MERRTTVSLGGDLLERVEAEKKRMGVASKARLSFGLVAKSLIEEALDARDAARKKGAKS
jgi:hypothetical protein